VAGSDALFLVLDGVTDPHNLGACLRSAAAANVTAVIVPKDRAVGLTPVVRRASAGGADRVPLVAATNLARAMRTLKDAGVWITGLAGDTEQSIYDVDLKGPVALVLGSEGEGMRRLTRENCDFVARIPMPGSMESLNVSVATGVVLFEALRQRSLR
jgi:23S rRNA (guanosine2251-2'-O)-methyltransferase